MDRAVVIGGSAGSVDALSTLLGALPAHYPWPVMVVVHLPPDRNSVLVELLAKKCRMRVVEAEDKMALEGGCVYVAPPDYHMLVEAERVLSLAADEPVRFSRPSIDVLFESAADVYGSGLIGVVVTGANDDGARGLRLICHNGGRAVVQDPAQAYASAMPEAAIKACPKAQVAPIEEIGKIMCEEIQP